MQEVEIRTTHRFAPDPMCGIIAKMTPVAKSFLANGYLDQDSPASTEILQTMARVRCVLLEVRPWGIASKSASGLIAQGGRDIQLHCLLSREHSRKHCWNDSRQCADIRCQVLKATGTRAIHPSTMVSSRLLEPLRYRFLRECMSESNVSVSFFWHSE